jgi:CHRD domain
VFVANLSGAQGVSGPPFLAPQPGIETDTTERFRISFDRALTKARFRLSVNHGVDIMQAHLHCAPAGVNGPIAVFLFPFTDPAVDANGLLSEGELTNDSFVASAADCPTTCGKPVNNIASLQAAILDGCIYANVHSVAHGAGEVRGQVRPAEEP